MGHVITVETAEDESICVGDYVETVGLIDEDSDAGRVVAIDGTDLEVAWDGGFCTTIDAGSVRVIPRGYRSRHGRDNGLPVYE